MKQYDLISLLIFLLFCAVTFMGVQNHKKVVLDIQTLENRQAIIRKHEIEDAYFEALKYKDNVTHDSNPSTKTYPISLKATGSYDAENDEMTYIWSQLSGDTVELSSTSDKIIYFLANAGDYEFMLTVEDIYGAQGTETKIVEIKEEPNTAPVAVINIMKKIQPK